MKPTIKDVAEKAGVALSTASRSLNNTGRISAATRERVMKAAKELNYTPNVFASSLRATKSNIIGIIFPNLFAGHFWSEVYRGIEECAESNNLYIAFGNSNNSEEKEAKLIEMFISMKVDGFIISPTINSNTDIYEKLIELNIPFIFVDSYVKGVPCNFVGTNNSDGGKLMVRHLYEKGHRNIGVMLGGNSFNEESVEGVGVTTGNLGTRANSILGRYDGINTELESYGIKPVILDIFNSIVAPYEYGYQMVKNNILLFKNKELSALIVVTDSLAMGAYRAFEEAGLKVGEDVAIIGYNNDPLCNYMSPPLDSVEQYKYNIGFQATNLLIQNINDRTLPEQHIALPGKIVERSSTFQLK